MREAALLDTDKAQMSRGPDHQNSNTQRRDCPLLEHRLQPMESNQHCYQHAPTHTQLLHPTMFMLILIFPAHTVKGPLNTPRQRYWATHMHTHCGSVFNMTKASLQW